MQSASGEFPADNRGKTILGFPLRGFGLFTSFLLSFALALLTFCITTMIAIFSLLVWNLGFKHSVDFALSYRDIGFPASLVVLVLALPFFLVLWIRAKFRE